MGQGYLYKCSRCGEEYSVNKGIGMMFPSEYKSIVSNIRKGRFGKEMQDDFNKVPHMAVDIERNYYECDDCGYWDVLNCLDLYEPKDTSEEKDSYVMSDELKANYILFRKYEHRCPECNGHMTERNRRRKIRCPRCGHKNMPAGMCMWD